MDYAELAKRLRAFNYGASEGANHHPKVCIEAADAIEALTSPPDEAQVDAAIEAYVKLRSMSDALNAAHRIRVKKEAKA